ncbi:MAG: ATP-dependent DNA ligase [Acidimicrobiia bacterium]|nr:ATP-dependent DNA ligase [Acidimicrobiia bacterium]
MLLSDVVAASRDVAEVAGRKAKVARLADLLSSAQPAEIPIVVGFLTGELRQGKVGVGFATIRDLDVGASPSPSLTVQNVDGLADELHSISGPGSQIEKFDALRAVYGRATSDEQEFISRLFLGEVRHGALDGVMIEAIAAAAEVKAADVRRAQMLRGDLREVAETAITEGVEGLADVGLELFRPLQPMLAKTAESLEGALDQLGTAIFEWKLDGVRVQVHRNVDNVRLFTRNLKDVTDRSPEVAEIVRGFPAKQFVLDGEVIALRDNGRPFPFQVTMGRFGRHSDDGADLPLTPFFFDILHLNGTDTVDDGAQRRLERLMSAVPERFRIPQLVTADLGRAQGFLDEALEAGHEGVMIKSLDAAYAAGRRGAAWQKLKPAHILDLVVLAVEWGHGRRTGWLSNLHLGAFDPATGEYVMLGKTFKGLTDEMLEWQTERFIELETHRRGHVVYVRPEQVVEVAFDGIQASTRYPGRMALRFARVKRYRDDKRADEADPISVVRAIFEKATA